MILVFRICIFAQVGKLAGVLAMACFLALDHVIHYFTAIFVVYAVLGHREVLLDYHVV